MLSSVQAATLRTGMERGPRLQAAAAPRVGAARRAARSSPEKRGPTTGHPGKGYGTQVGAAGLRVAARGWGAPGPPRARVAERGSECLSLDALGTGWSSLSGSGTDLP